MSKRDADKNKSYIATEAEEYVRRQEAGCNPRSTPTPKPQRMNPHGGNQRSKLSITNENHDTFYRIDQARRAAGLPRLEVRKQMSKAEMRAMIADATKRRTE